MVLRRGVRPAAGKRGAGSRLLYTLGVNGHAPKVFTKLTRFQVPWVAVLFTSILSGLLFGASFIGAGQLWTWLQNIVGVSNQLSWISIGIASLRFRGELHLGVILEAPASLVCNCMSE